LSDTSGDDGVRHGLGGNELEGGGGLGSEGRGGSERGKGRVLGKAKRATG